MTSERWDVIEAEGGHRLGLDEDELRTLANPRGLLRLGFRHRLPFLGPVLRNHWAKRNGARLFRM